jgi:hypothetical protein
MQPTLNFKVNCLANILFEYKAPALDIHELPLHNDS